MVGKHGRKEFGHLGAVRVVRGLCLGLRCRATRPIPQAGRRVGACARSVGTLNGIHFQTLGLKMSKKRERNNRDDIHQAMVKHLRDEQMGQGELADFLDEREPARPIKGDPLEEFNKALYRLCYFAYKMRDDREEWRWVNGIVRDAAVGIVEFK